MTVHSTDPFSSLKSKTYAAGAYERNLAADLGPTARIVGIQMTAVPNAVVNTNVAKAAFGWNHDTFTSPVFDVFFTITISNRADALLPTPHPYFGQASVPSGDPVAAFVAAAPSGVGSSTGQFTLPMPVSFAASAPTGSGSGSNAAGGKSLFMTVTGAGCWITIFYKDDPAK